MIEKTRPTAASRSQLHPRTHVLYASQTRSVAASSASFFSIAAAVLTAITSRIISTIVGFAISTSIATSIALGLAATTGIPTTAHAETSPGSKASANKPSQTDAATTADHAPAATTPSAGDSALPTTHAVTPSARNAASVKTHAAKIKTGAHADASLERPQLPRLILTVVLDQFRADALMHWRQKFSRGGFRRLLDQGAVYPFAQYPVLQNMTCPGHTMILSGSVPAQNHIPLNEWYDPKSKKQVYCVEDDKDGLSPRRAAGDMLGDEMKLRWHDSKVVGVSFKDRAAIMLAGHAADAAYWFDDKTLKFASSSYYKNASTDVVGWTPDFTPKKEASVVWKNTRGSREFSKTYAWGSGESFATPLGLDLTLAAAERAFEKHHLAQGPTPDLLAVSFSTHDLVAHRTGPDAPEVEDLTLHEDEVVAQLFDYLEHHVPGGMNSVWVFFTADHGAAPLVEDALSIGLPAGRIDQKARLSELNEKLAQKFGLCKDGWIAGFKSFNFYYSPECTDRIGARMAEFETFARQAVLAWPGVATVFTRGDNERGFFPTNFESELKKTYVPGISGDLILIPRPFWYEQSVMPATHMTSYTYDRTVPVILMGAPFRKGVYGNAAQVIDGAPTLAYLLRITAPALNQGRVLTEALMPEKL